LYAESQGTILDPTGREALSLEGRTAGYYSVPVPDDADGELWKVHQAAASIRLLTVPPYLARSPDELLLPREVVEQESRKR
jgi:hypothetical protein